MDIKCCPLTTIPTEASGYGYIHLSFSEWETTPSLTVRNESNTEIEVKTNVSFIVKVMLPAAVHYVQQMLKVFIDSQSHF
jgi:hypothetical protein